jgi:hypothetical protein
MTQARWNAEIELVARNGLPFTPFESKSGSVGFAGILVGKSGRRYEVVIKVPASEYPATEPKTYMEPKPEEHHWIRSGPRPYLCYQRAKGWNPAKSTFANCILIAVKYVDAFD